MSSISIRSSSGTYSVTIEAGALTRLGAITRDVAPAQRALLAVDLKIATTHGKAAEAALRSAGYDVAVAMMRASEKSKSLATVSRLYDEMLMAKLDRRCPVVALGGGVIGDAAGFAAATFMRGLPLILVPTSLLAMVDASIGGKTGVNLVLPHPDRGLGKNLAGAFWPPRAVVADPLVLRSLAVREWRSGLAECVKHGLLGDAALLALVERSARELHDMDAAAVVELVDRSVRVKAAIVEADEHETGARALLNLGHTFAHVIEPMTEQRINHGEAVAIGLVAAMHAAQRLGRVDQTEIDHLTRLLALLHLPTKMRAAAPLPMLMDRMSRDKKVAAGKLRLVLPRRGGGADVVDDVPREVIEAAWQAVMP